MDEKLQPTDIQTSVYNELRWEGNFTDAIIKVEDEEFQVHKVILSNCTPFFRAMFTRWNPKKQQVFSIMGLSSQVMALILDYAYTGFLSVTESNVSELLKAVDYLNILEAVQTCCDFLQQRLQSHNCVDVWKLTNVFFLPDLRNKAFFYILEHFEEVVLGKEFLQLSAAELCDIIRPDSLNVKEERTVYKAIMRWVEHIPEQRHEHLPALLVKVRLALLDAHYITNTVMENHLVQRHCLSIMSEVSSITQANTYARPRFPRTILLAIGGSVNGDPTNTIEAYDTKANMWRRVNNGQERARAGHGSAFLGGFVYCIGGSDPMEHFNSVRKYDPVTHTWEEVSPMYFRRCYVSVTVLNGCIYAIGGFDGHRRLSSAESYNPDLNQWSLIAPMNVQRNNASCTTFQRRIYVCGGFNGHDCLQTAECYDPNANQWTMITPMQSLRSGVGVVAYAGRLFAVSVGNPVGGFDGNRRLRSVEAYNPQTQLWENFASMETQRSNFGIEVIAGSIIVVGGYNGSTTTCKAECYNIATGTWVTIADMMVYRSALSCCVLHGLPNMWEYVVPREGLPWQHKVEEEKDK